MNAKPLFFPLSVLMTEKGIDLSHHILLDLIQDDVYYIMEQFTVCGACAHQILKFQSQKKTFSKEMLLILNWGFMAKLFCLSVNFQHLSKLLLWDCLSCAKRKSCRARKWATWKLSPDWLHYFVYIIWPIRCKHSFFYNILLQLFFKNSCNYSFIEEGRKMRLEFGINNSIGWENKRIIRLWMPSSKQGVLLVCLSHFGYILWWHLILNSNGVIK